MPVDNCRIAFRLRVQRKLRNLMQQQKFELPDRDHLSNRQTRGPVALIDVSTHHEQRRNPAKLLDDIGIADVPRMHNDVCAPQGGNSLGTEQPVGVGNDADKNSARGHRLLCKRCGWIKIWASRAPFACSREVRRYSHRPSSRIVAASTTTSRSCARGQTSRRHNLAPPPKRSLPSSAKGQPAQLCFSSSLCSPYARRVVANPREACQPGFRASILRSG